jgi:hypothetical protein
MKEGLKDGFEILHPSPTLSIHCSPQNAGAFESNHLPGRQFKRFPCLGIPTFTSMLAFD